MNKFESEAVIKVGDGRGFVVETRRRGRLVVTAGHCLPSLPPSYPAAHFHERSYGNLLDSIGGNGSVTAECVYVDPIGDLAVLGSPDDQALSEEAEAYEELVEGRPALEIAAMSKSSTAWVLELNGNWQECDLEIGVNGRTLTLVNTHVVGGISGSPILNNDGRAIGVVSVGPLVNQVEQTVQHGQPSLVNGLPVWLLVELLASIEQLPAIIKDQHRAWERYQRTQAKRAAPKKGGA